MDHKACCRLCVDHYRTRGGGPADPAVRVDARCLRDLVEQSIANRTGVAGPARLSTTAARAGVHTLRPCEWAPRFEGPSPTKAPPAFYVLTDQPAVGVPGWSCDRARFTVISALQAIEQRSRFEGSFWASPRAGTLHISLAHRLNPTVASVQHSLTQRP